ncbi:peptide deformylase [Ligilactobacillus acidipiscis]|uniref:Peptide deformylase n=2 Tax=Ligilactobacillus acidipiscis TaxID=89059 RepID=A0A1K1KPH9_9LACO|nr:peptide deformylase [Ligilactobacillus acidipiscis]WEV55970.1 peptide deformylase [Ligilactobacillus acidipiscis]SFV40778.1 Peptide deformylase [Ligilactobacillus acidipiscis]GAW63458.1 peptide deformylase [Ligilactobacillus acidipiscis]GEN22003.1 peptide deformylase [Ligilactobacillus acidipiscis]HJE97872.1 peptide deformylase [Ligilactobacillus acidipiscis]
MILMDDITRDGNPVLRSRAKELTFPLSDKEIEMGKKMMEYLEVSQDEKLAEKYHLRAGVGLAAPQVGSPTRMAAVLVPSDYEEEPPAFKEILVNPTILSESVQGAALGTGEGCLSVDEDIPGYVWRHDRIKLRWYDLDGNKHISRLKDYPAIVVQHEFDHLNGVLFYDHINKDARFKSPDGGVLIG